MKITFIRDTMLEGMSVEAGETRDVSPDTARLLVGIKKAVFFVERDEPEEDRKSEKDKGR